jgi:hypothetical protein
MLSLALALPRAALPLGAVDTASAVVVAMVLGAVVLVFWASRPSVIARYSADAGKNAVTPPADAAASAETETRA